MEKLLVVALICVFTSMGCCAHHKTCGTGKEGAQKVHEETQQAVVYTCPMHPEVRQATPSSCPKCGMALQKV